MTRHVREELLALYEAGDLSGGERAAIARHLEDCAACRQTLREYRDVLAFVVRSLVEPSAADLAAVRRGIEAGRAPLAGADRRWAWLLAPAAMAAMLLAFARFDRVAAPRATLAPPSQVVRLEPAVLNVPVVMAARRLPLPRRQQQLERAGIRAVSLVASAHGPDTIRMTTADPNVVILWQIEDSKEER